MTFKKARIAPIPTPLFTVVNQQVRTLALLRHLPDYLHWTLLEKTDYGFVLKHYNDTLCLATHYFNAIIAEWYVWKKYYLPNFSLKGKIVLDVGAGCGETAHFYFLHGAKKVFAIEPDAGATRLLEKNASANGWKIEIIHDSFRLEHLRLPHDYMKMDIEGFEVILLKFQSCLKPCVIEVHNQELIDKLGSKFGLHVVRQMAPGIALLSTAPYGK